MILNSAGNDFGGRSGVVVDEDDDGNSHALIATDGGKAAFRCAATVIGNDSLALFEEHITNGNGFVEKAAGIAAHVEDESVERIGAKHFEGVGNFAIGGFVELREADVADAGLEHERNFNGVAGNFVAGDGENERIGITFAGDGDFYDRALGTFQEIGNFTGGEAVGGFLVDFDDDVTGTEARVVGGCADVGRHDHGVIFARGHDHADAVVFAALIFTEKSELARVKEIGVRVKHAEHTGDGTLVDGLVDIDRVGVVVLNDIEDARKVANGGLIVVGGGRCGADGGAIDGAKASGECQDYDDDYNATSFSVHVYLVVYRWLDRGLLRSLVSGGCDNRAPENPGWVA